MERIVVSTLESSVKMFFSQWTSTDLEIWVENSYFCYSTYRKCFTEVLSLVPGLILLPTVVFFTFHTLYKNDMIGDDGNADKMLKNNLL